MPLTQRPARWEASDLAAFDGLEAFDGPELPWSQWSLRPSAIAAAVETAAGGDRPAILELGSGPSTVVLSRWAKEREGSVVSVEHDPRWADTIRALLHREDLDRVAGVVDAALHPLQGPEPEGTMGFEWPREWYEPAAIHAACPAPIDLLIVDGPPGGAAPRVLVRAPALPVLRDLLAPEAVLVLDDVGRPAERATAWLWHRLLGMAFEIRDDVDVAVLRPG